MKLLFAAAECAPFFKTGGLGDVAGSLPKEIARNGVDTVVVLPYFTKMADRYKEQLVDLFHFEIEVGWRRQYCGVKSLQQKGVTYYFIDNMYYFDRENLYGYYDDGERFAFFQMAVIELMEKIDFIADVVHVNDYHTAFIPVLLKEKYHWIHAYQGLRTVLTIHNIEFQGQYGPNVLADLFGMGTERYEDGTLRLGDALNFMKGGILYADRVTTVSPSYAQEIQTQDFGCGLDPILRMESGKLSGILNGIDYENNDPETDPFLTEHYSLEDLSGKDKNKAALQKEMGLRVDPTVPLIAVVSRLTYQKGFQLVVDELENLMQLDVQFVLLGTGDPDFEYQLTAIGASYPEKCAIRIDFDLSLAQRMYASADMFLMPSAFEPCGLSQMIAMRYGTIPVVHKIGGLKDTVIPFNPVEGQGTGFGFREFTSYQMMECLKKAIELYHDSPVTWSDMVHQAMIQDFSWNNSCSKYLALYSSLGTIG